MNRLSRYARRVRQKLNVDHCFGIPMSYFSRKHSPEEKGISEAQEEEDRQQRDQIQTTQQMIQKLKHEMNASNVEDGQSRTGGDGNESQLLKQSLLLMSQMQMQGMLREMQEERRKKLEKAAQKKSPEDRITSLVPWWVSFLYKNFLAATLVVLYVLYVMSIKPWMDMKSTFSGVKQNRITSEEEIMMTGNDRNDDCQKLKDMIDNLDPKRIMMLIGAPDSGKTTLMEHLLTNVIAKDSKDEYDICHVALKGSAGGLDAFFTRLRSGFALEEPMLDALIRKSLHLQENKEAQGQHSELVEMGTALERRLQVRSRIGLTRKNVQRIIFIDDCNTLQELYEKGHGHVFQEFLTWFAQLEGCHVVMAANDGFITNIIKELGLDRNMLYVVLNDCNKEEVRMIYDAHNSTRSMTEEEKEKEFEDLYDKFGGRIRDWKSYCSRHGGDNAKVLALQTAEVDKLIKSSVESDSNRGWSPQAARTIFKAILDNGDVKNVQNDLLTVGKGNGLSSCGSGVSISSLMRKKEVTMKDLVALSREKIISLDPTTRHVTFSSRFLYKQIRDHPELWI